jgi:hypothetical protein
MTLNFRTRLISFAALAIIASFGCKKEKSTPQEFITKVQLQFESSIGTPEPTLVFEAVDSDADGIFNSIDTIRLPLASFYSSKIFVYDETQTPVVDLTEEIKEENTDHLFVYKSTLANLNISNLNTDDDGLPFGSESVWTISGEGKGSVTISLYHEPTDKNAADPGGDVDFQVVFPVIIE